MIGNLIGNSLGNQKFVLELNQNYYIGYVKSPKAEILWIGVLNSKSFQPHCI